MPRHLGQGSYLDRGDLLNHALTDAFPIPTGMQKVHSKVDMQRFCVAG